MNPALKGVWQHIRELGLSALAHANRHAAYVSFENARVADLSILQAAHAAELLIKARIAQEHPLLIFDELPKSTKAAGTRLDLQDLFQQGKTIQWSDLPERLWAATGLRLAQKDAFLEFGKLRNGVQHFGPPPSGDASELTLRFVFSVIDPFINECWGLYAIDYDEDHEPYVYLVPSLVYRRIEFLVSPDAAAVADHWEVDWKNVSSGYRKRIKQQLAALK